MVAFFTLREVSKNMNRGWTTLGFSLKHNPRIDNLVQLNPQHNQNSVSTMPWIGLLGMGVPGPPPPYSPLAMGLSYLLTSLRNVDLSVASRKFQHGISCTQSHMPRTSTTLTQLSLIA